MVRRVVLIGFAVCLAAALVGCRDTGAGKRQASSKRRPASREPLIKRYDPRKQVQEWVQTTKGEGEGEKVKVYLSPSAKDQVVGQLNFGAYVIMVDQAPGWYGVRYYSPDGAGEFFGWIRIDQTRYIGPRGQQNEVIAVNENEDQRALSIEEADEAMRAILAVPYKYVEGRGGQQEKQFWGGKDADGEDDLTLLTRIPVSSEAKAWARQCQVELSNLSRRTPAQYHQVLKAYYDALQWYVADNKSQFTKMLRQADDKRNEFAQFFGN